MKDNSVVFMGNSDFSLKSLVALYEAGFNIVGVYTKPPKRSGRKYKIQKSVVHKFAEDKGLPVYCPNTFKLAKNIEEFRSLKPDVVVVVSYGLIIRRIMLDIPSRGFINVHASALPRWRGAAPIQAAILAGDKKTGITIMKMDEGIDTGDIISMKLVDICPETTYGELSERLGDLGATMIVETLNNLDDALSNARKQPEEGAVYVTKISKESYKINWNNSAQDVLRQIKAFSPAPAAWTEINGLRVKIIDAKIADEDSRERSGFIGEKMTVACGVGSLRLTLVQPSGKNKMSGEDFIRGRKDLVGKIAG
ncbi:MAG: methionyl-tRNA formyltransferase [Holosporaceae bacterium]|jgi:methionyl-tRNA formyltransferase|nr:methionyl-tRNA formyltransferase [Holosporaceae bacterium]